MDKVNMYVAFLPCNCNESPKHFLLIWFLTFTPPMHIYVIIFGLLLSTHMISIKFRWNPQKRCHMRRALEWEEKSVDQGPHVENAWFDSFYGDNLIFVDPFMWSWIPGLPHSRDLVLLWLFQVNLGPNLAFHGPRDLTCPIKNIFSALKSKRAWLLMILGWRLRSVDTAFGQVSLER